MLSISGPSLFIKQAMDYLRSIRKRELHIKVLLMICASVTFVGLLLIFIFVFRESLPAFTRLGLPNLFSTHWNPDVSHPEAGNYGMLPFVVGTLYTTLGGLLVGAPLGIGSAIFIDQIAPPKIGTAIGRGIELIASIPSVVIGWFGLTLLVPMIGRLTDTSGFGILAASLVLGVMVLPTIAALSLESLRALPSELKEAAYGMGATRWQTIYKVLLPAARRGVLVAVILGMGRAIGEAMAVQMVIGNSRQLTFSLTNGTSTLAARIVTDMGESSGVFRSALFAQGLILLILAMLLILTIRLVSREKKETVR